MMTELLKEAISLPALSGGLLPISVNGQTNSGTIDMKLFNRAVFIASLGLGVATGNINLQQTNNSNGATATNISGCAYAYVANSGVVRQEVRSDQLTARYVKMNIVTDGAILVSIVGEGHVCRYDPANAYDSTSVLQSQACNT